MRLRADVIAALSAAVRRVYGNIGKEERDREIAWALVELEQMGLKHNLIVWRRLAIGRLLFESLGEAQNWRCCYCGVRMLEARYWFDTPSLEHVVSLALDGPDHPNNLVMACRHCNSTKGWSLWDLLHPGVPFVRENLRRA